MADDALAGLGRTRLPRHRQHVILVEAERSPEAVELVDLVVERFLQGSDLVVFAVELVLLALDLLVAGADGAVGFVELALQAVHRLAGLIKRALEVVAGEVEAAAARLADRFH